MLVTFSELANYGPNNLSHERGFFHKWPVNMFCATRAYIFPASEQSKHIWEILVIIACQHKAQQTTPSLHLAIN